jgi:hypothetical protein
MLCHRHAEAKKEYSKGIPDLHLADSRGSDPDSRTHLQQKYISSRH